VVDARLGVERAQRVGEPVAADAARGRGDPRVARQLLELDPVATGERVVGGQRDVDHVVADGALAQPLRNRQRLVVPVLGDGHVEIAADDQRDAPARVLLAQQHPQPGMVGAETAQRAGEQSSGRRGERRDRQLPDHGPAVRLQIGLRLLDQGEDPVGMVDQQLGGVGEAHAPAVAFEQLLPGLPFQLGQLLGDGGGGHVQDVGGGAHRAVGRDRMQRPQTFQIEHVAMLKL
jgi:hypothetical protein